MKRNRNSVVRAFESAFAGHLESAGIQPTRTLFGGAHEYEIQTVAGTYTFHCPPQINLNGRTLNHLHVFGRFSDPGLAKQHVDCNPFNGKWNFEGLGYVPTEQDAESLAQRIAQRILSLRAP